MLLAAARPLRAQRLPRVVYLNPGEPVSRASGAHWPLTSRFMTLAAQALGFELEVLYADRDHLLMLRQAEQVAQRSPAPDYLVAVNVKLTAEQVLQTLAPTQTRVLFIHTDVSPEQRRSTGHERERFARWIGTAVTDVQRGSFRLTEALYREHGATEPQIVGITGDPTTPVSHDAARGMQDFVDGAGRGRVLQVVNGDWSYADAEQKAYVLLARYPQANTLWAAADSMALGALRAVQARSANVRVGGMVGLPDALESVAAGGLSATAAGHYLIGAWAMVLLHDYHRGTDFAERGGPLQKLDYLYIVNRARVARYEQFVFRQPEAIDFRAMSLALHRRRGDYDFRLEPLLRQRPG